jgi:hypothetical protein
VARIKTAVPGATLRRIAHNEYGYVPGIVQVLWPDLLTAIGTGILYDHLHHGRSSRLSRLQREMIATVVNGKIGGAA